MQKEPILLLGNCGFERLASELEEDFAVTVAGLNDQHLIEALRPVFVYVDLFDWTVMTPMYASSIRGKAHQLPVAYLRMLVDSLSSGPVWFRGIRRPSGGSFGIWEKNPLVQKQLAVLETLIEGVNTIDIQSLWARHGLVLDDVIYGLGHGEALIQGGSSKPAVVEANAVRAIVSSRSAIKCIVVDLDDTLIHGNITAEDFAARNPAYAERSDREQAWWRLRRGLHEALQIARQRGILLALASRNESSTVCSRFLRRSDLGEDPASIALSNIALDIHDFQVLEIGFHDKSESCRRIASILGIGLDALAFADNSRFEQEEVASALPMVHVLRGAVEGFREEILCGSRFQPWYEPLRPELRADSYRSRAVVASQPLASVAEFLRGMDVELTIRRAGKEDAPRILSLLQRTNQLVLCEGKDLPIDPHEAWVASLRDRLADHGLIAVGIFVQEGGEYFLRRWVCSCRVLPHRVAASILHAMCGQYSKVRVRRDELPRNGATKGLIEEAKNGIASWVSLSQSIPYPSSMMDG